MRTPSSEAEQALLGVLEALAAIEHERWSAWQRYMHDHGVLQQDGSLLFPAELVTRWEHQIQTPYGSLTEEEKESDREQVRRYLPVIRGLLERN
jgi:hypothetical protein